MQQKKNRCLQFNEQSSDMTDFIKLHKISNLKHDSVVDDFYEKIQGF